MIWFVPFISMWPLFFVYQQESTRFSTDGFHKLKEFGNHQSRGKVSNWWAESGTQRCSFKILSELPAFKIWEISHVSKIQIFSFSWNIRRSGNIEPVFLLGNTRLNSRIAAVPLAGAWTLKFARVPTTLSPPWYKGQRSFISVFNVAIIWMFYSFLRPAGLFQASEFSRKLMSGWNWGYRLRAILSLKILACNFQVHDVWWYSF